MFVLGLLPSLGHTIGYYVDEAYYTDVAIRMTQTGDYITPHYLSDGRARFNKPIVTYWMIAASYKLLGINFFSSRLPSLIAGALIVWLTYKLAWMLFKNRKGACLAAIAMLSNNLLITYSGLAMPDIFLTLFLAASCCGFAAILFDKDKSLMNYAMAYVGAGLAVETKGMIGLFLVAFVFVFCAFLRGGTTARCREMVEWKMLLLGVAVALSWFVAIYLIHGVGAIIGHPGLRDGFLADQFSDEVSKKAFRPFQNALFYLESPFHDFIPWMLFLLIGIIPDRGLFLRFWKEHRGKLLFILAWSALLVAIFAMAKQTRGRYIMPAYPMLAAAIGALLADILDNGKSGSWIRGVGGALLLVMAAVGLALAVSGIWLGWTFTASGILLLIVAGGSFLWSFRGKDIVRFGGLAVSVLFAVSIFVVVVRPKFDATPLPAMAQKLVSERIEGSKVAGVGLPSRAASQINVLSKGLVQIKMFEKGAAFSDVQNYPVLLLSHKYLTEWDLSAFDVQPCGYDYAAWTSADFSKLLHGGSFYGILDAQKTAYYIAVKKNSL